jgi:hypothetical protein
MTRALGLFDLALAPSAVVYFPATRYRAPVEFVMFFYSAIPIDWMAGKRIAT